jgi:heme/copper-type cytochrome/quinol oxidase subunit 4
MELNSVLTAVSMISIFFSGYFCRKRNVAGVLICAFISQIPVSVAITMTGMHEYIQRTVDTSAEDWTTALIIVITVWGIGFILGGINIQKKDNIDDFQGKDEKRDMHRLD